MAKSNFKTGDKIIVESLDCPHQISKVDTANVFETVPAPIDEKNIISDWIYEELLDGCSQYGSEYLGWFEEHPVYTKVENNGELMIKTIDGSSIRPIIMAIQRLFDANPDNDIYIHFQTPDTTIGDRVKASFHFVLSQN